MADEKNETPSLPAAYENAWLVETIGPGHRAGVFWRPGGPGYAGIVGAGVFDRETADAYASRRSKVVDTVVSLADVLRRSHKPSECGPTVFDVLVRSEAEPKSWPVYDWRSTDLVASDEWRTMRGHARKRLHGPEAHALEAKLVATEIERDRYRTALEHIATGGISPSITFAHMVLAGESLLEAHRLDAGCKDRDSEAIMRVNRVRAGHPVEPPRLPDGGHSSHDGSDYPDEDPDEWVPLGQQSPQGLGSNLSFRFAYQVTEDGETVLDGSFDDRDGAAAVCRILMTRFSDGEEAAMKVAEETVNDIAAKLRFHAFQIETQDRGDDSQEREQAARTMQLAADLLERNDDGVNRALAGWEEWARHFVPDASGHQAMRAGVTRMISRYRKDREAAASTIASETSSATKRPVLTNVKNHDPDRRGAYHRPAGDSNGADPSRRKGRP